jgi:hypothetical protein
MMKWKAFSRKWSWSDCGSFPVFAWREEEEEDDEEEEEEGGGGGEEGGEGEEEGE